MIRCIYFPYLQAQCLQIPSIEHLVDMEIEGMEIIRERRSEIRLGIRIPHILTLYYIVCPRCRHVIEVSAYNQGRVRTYAVDGSPEIACIFRTPTECVSQLRQYCALKLLYT